MALEDDFREVLNDALEDARFPMRIDEVHIYGPDSDLYFDRIEPIHDIEHLFRRSPIFMLIRFDYFGSVYEYEIRYRNIEKQLLADLVEVKHSWSKLGVDAEKETDRMNGSIMKVFPSRVIPDVFKNLYEKRMSELS